MITRACFSFESCPLCGWSGREDDAESAGVPGAFAADEPIRDLGDAGMVLRDPAPFHLMLHQVMRRLEHCVDLQIKPKDDPELLLLTRLLILAMDARPMLINNTYAFAGESQIQSVCLQSQLASGAGVVYTCTCGCKAQTFSYVVNAILLLLTVTITPRFSHFSSAQSPTKTSLPTSTQCWRI